MRIQFFIEVCFISENKGRRRQSVPRIVNNSTILIKCAVISSPPKKLKKCQAVHIWMATIAANNLVPKQVRIVRQFFAYRIFRISDENFIFSFWRHTDRQRISNSSQTKVTKMLLIVSTVFVLLNSPSYAFRIIAYLVVSASIPFEIHSLSDDGNSIDLHRRSTKKIIPNLRS